jgi:hypothetical protein
MRHLCVLFCVPQPVPLVRHTQAFVASSCNAPFFASLQDKLWGLTLAATVIDESDQVCSCKVTMDLAHGDHLWALQADHTAVACDCGYVARSVGGGGRRSTATNSCTQCGRSSRSSGSGGGGGGGDDDRGGDGSAGGGNGGGQAGNSGNDDPDGDNSDGYKDDEGSLPPLKMAVNTPLNLAQLAKLCVAPGAILTLRMVEERSMPCSPPKLQCWRRTCACTSPAFTTNHARRPAHMSLPPRPALAACYAASCVSGTPLTYELVAGDVQVAESEVS